MLSFPHLVVIFLVALVVLGPEKLPQVARVLGKAMAEFNRITADFRSQLDEEMRHLEQQSQEHLGASSQPILKPAPQVPDAPALNPGAEAAGSPGAVKAETSVEPQTAEKPHDVEPKPA